MKYTDAKAALNALLYACEDDRDVEAALSCVTDDIRWIGTELGDTAIGKEALRRLLTAKAKAAPKPPRLRVDSITAYPDGENAVSMVFCAHQPAVPGVAGDYSVRGTAECVKREGGWLVRQAHVSVPNAEREKYALKRELDENRLREQNLMAGIPGDAAICRMAKGDAVHTDDESKRIAEEESRLKRLVNEVPSGIGIYEIEEGVIKLTYLNDAYYHTIGVTRDERTQYVNEEHLNTVVEEDRGNMLALVDRLMNGADDDSTTYRIFVNQTYKWMQMSAHVVRRAGKHLTVYTTISDCDSMMKAQMELNAARKREQALLASIPGGIAIYRLRKDGTVHTDYVSDGLAKMCGYRDGAELQEIFKENALDNVVDEDRAQLHEAVAQSCKSGQPLSVLYRIHTKDQGDIQNRTDATVSFEGLKEDEAVILYAVQTHVSDAAMQSIREQMRYRRLLSALDIALFEWSEENGFYSTENFQRYELGRQDPQAILKNEGDMSVIYPEDAGRIKAFFAKMKSGDPQAQVSLRMKMTDGTYRWTEMLYFTERDGNGKLTRAIGVLRDIDQERIEQNERLNKALEAARSASKAKTAFLSRISHDMRTPLNGILGITALMQESIEGEKAQMDLQQLEMSGKYLLNLINDTLDVSKIESGKLELHPCVCDGRLVFNNVLALIKPNLDARKINFTVHANNLPFTMLNIDVGRVEQIVMNILGNAVKFTPEGGSIDFTMTNISGQDDLIIDEIVIKDSGIGMSAAFLPHLFEPFSQENTGRTSSFQGSGLGMAITKQLIELMGGTIRVESALGKGTTFTLVLPLKIATEEEVEKWEALKTVKKNNVTLEGKRILLCEDHPLNANIATRLLKKRGMLVELAENGGIGVAMFQQSPPNYYDAILMDIRMPVMDGLDAARTIR